MPSQEALVSSYRLAVADFNNTLKGARLTILFLSGKTTHDCVSLFLPFFWGYFPSSAFSLDFSPIYLICIHERERERQ